MTRNPYWRGRLSTIYLLVLTSIDQHILYCEYYLPLLQNKLRQWALPFSEGFLQVWWHWLTKGVLESVQTSRTRSSSRQIFDEKVSILLQTLWFDGSAAESRRQSSRNDDFVATARPRRRFYLPVVPKVVFQQKGVGRSQQVSVLKKYIFIQLGFSVSSWQKVQLNIDLFLDMQKYLYTE